MTVFCDFDVTSQEGKYWHLQCKRCGIKRRSLRPRLTRICDDQGTSAPEPEQLRRRAVCLPCRKFDRGLGGCRFCKQCERRARWESLLRVGSCPKDKW